MVNNPGGSALGGPALITVTQPVLPPVILSGPESQTAVVGSDVSYTVQASGQDLSYQWQHNGSDVAGATGSSLTLDEVQLADAGTYTVVVSNAGGSVSSSASWSVTSGTTVQPPVILAGPQSQSVAAGSDVTLTVVRSSADPYQ